jgi:hypothetical protein
LSLNRSDDYSFHDGDVPGDFSTLSFESFKDEACRVEKDLLDQHVSFNPFAFGLSAVLSTGEQLKFC